MLVDGGLSFRIDDVGADARELEREGYDGAWSAETGHDPLLIVAGAATTTTTLELGTGIVVAFARSPMITATMANDVQLLSHGRLLLGLGSQIKPHIEKRYSMPWSHPAPRMREYVLAMRAIWDCWNEGTPLNFRGEFYRHTLMSPFFNPGPNPYGAPKVYLAAVGELMTEVAGEVADGLLVHPFSTERYLREVTLPALERGLAKSGRDLADFPISFSGLIATGDSDEALEDATRRGPRADRLLRLDAGLPRGARTPRLGRPAERTEHALEVRGVGTDGRTDRRRRPERLRRRRRRRVTSARVVRERFNDVVRRFSIYAPYALSDDARRAIVVGLRA